MPVAQGRVALVTGSSRGLGAAIARRLAQDGLAVAVNGRPGDRRAGDVARGIGDGGGIAEAFYADVTDEQQVAGLVAVITGHLGPVDVLVLNATGPQPEAPVTDVAWPDYLAQLSFFVQSPVLLGRAVLPGMQARRYGRIVNIDSEVAHRPPPGRSAYAIAKSAQIGPDPRLGPRTRPFRYHRQHGRARLRPRGASRRRPRRSQGRLPRVGTRWADGNSRRHRSRGELPRLRGRRLHHRPAHRSRRRPEPQIGTKNTSTCRLICP